MTINDFVEKAHTTAKEKGFWDNPRTLGELLMLIVSELGEALEADRHGKNSEGNINMILDIDDDELFFSTFKVDVKDTVQDEIADAVIRLFDLAGGWDMNLQGHIEAKMRYNSMRERLNGKLY